MGLAALRDLLVFSWCSCDQNHKHTDRLQYAACGTARFSHRVSARTLSDACTRSLWEVCVNLCHVKLKMRSQPTQQKSPHLGAGFLLSDFPTIVFHATQPWIADGCVFAVDKIAESTIFGLLDGEEAGFCVGCVPHNLQQISIIQGTG